MMRGQRPCRRQGAGATQTRKRRPAYPVRGQDARWSGGSAGPAAPGTQPLRRSTPPRERGAAGGGPGNCRQRRSAPLPSGTGTRRTVGMCRGARALQRGDVGGRRLRRDLVALPQRQQATITGPPAGPALPTCGAQRGGCRCALYRHRLWHCPTAGSLARRAVDARALNARWASRGPAFLLIVDRMTPHAHLADMLTLATVGARSEMN